jgi:predicted transposase YbfD/YdcC
MMKPTTNEANLSVPKTETLINIGSLRSYLERVPDPRAARGKRYQLVDLLTLVILAKLCGEDGFSGIADWVRLRGKQLVKLLGLSRTSMPHQTTYERVFGELDITAFEHEVGQYFAQSSEANISVCVDGKTLRGTINAAHPQGVHLLAAYDPQQGVVLMQVEVDTKHNEIVAAPRLLEQLDLRGRIVMADAMLTQHAICKQIVEAEGHYILPVKANHPTLQHDIAEAFLPPVAIGGRQGACLPQHTTQHIRLRSGRLEYRYLTTTDALNDFLDWPDVQQVFRLQRLVQHPAGRLTYQVVFGISSLSLDLAPPERLLALLQDYWHIENRLHYVRDVSFHEDACRIRHRRRQRFLATLNNLVIGLIRQCDFNFIPQARRFFDCHFEQALDLICS